MNDTYLYQKLDLSDGTIYLRLDHTGEADPARGWVPAYFFDICLAGKKIGHCDLRVGHNENTYVGGNIGYTIYEPYRGHRYAVCAVRLLLNLARRHDMQYIIIVCGLDNLASARTCELAGGKFVGIIPVPESNTIMRNLGLLEVRVYRFEL